MERHPGALTRLEMQTSSFHMGCLNDCHCCCFAADSFSSLSSSPLVVQYVNNKPLCDLIENKPGLLSICDDCCATAKTDSNFVMDLKGFFSGNNNIQCGQNDFSIRHYAGDVRVGANTDTDACARARVSMAVSKRLTLCFLFLLLFSPSSSSSSSSSCFSSTKARTS